MERNILPSEYIDEIRLCVVAYISSFGLIGCELGNDLLNISAGDFSVHLS